MRQTGGVLDDQLLAEARRGDETAFERLMAGHRREFYAHCYRMLGSVRDAEDALQESLLGAWRGLGGFDGRSSLRTWLFRVATNACLRLGSRRPRRILSSEHGPARSDPRELGEPVTGPVWLGPWPDELHLMIGAAVLGGGTPAFGTRPVPPLRLLGTPAPGGFGDLLLTYRLLSQA